MNTNQRKETMRKEENTMRNNMDISIIRRAVKEACFELDSFFNPYEYKDTTIVSSDLIIQVSFDNYNDTVVAYISQKYDGQLLDIKVFKDWKYKKLSDLVAFIYHL